MIIILKNVWYNEYKASKAHFQWIIWRIYVLEYISAIDGVCLNRVSVFKTYTNLHESPHFLGCMYISGELTPKQIDRSIA